MFNETFYEAVTTILIAGGICVVMPVMIVWLVVRNRMNETNRRTEMILAAIEKNSEIDVEQYFRSIADQKQQSTIKERLLKKLMWGSALTGIGLIALVAGIVFYVLGLSFSSGDVTASPSAIYYVSNAKPLLWAGGIMLPVGAGFLLSYFTGKKMLRKEMEAELENMQKGE